MKIILTLPVLILAGLEYCSGIRAMHFRAVAKKPNFLKRYWTKQISPEGDDIVLTEVWLDRNLDQLRSYSRNLTDSENFGNRKSHYSPPDFSVGASITDADSIPVANHYRLLPLDTGREGGTKRDKGAEEEAKGEKETLNLEERVGKIPGIPSPSNDVDSGSKLPLPLLNVESVGLLGKWEEYYRNFLLKPAQGIQPIGVIHFLGGAFVGAAPHITYRYLLESLAAEGYLVVATPYRLDLNYVRICDTVLSKFEPLGVTLAQEYGALPVIGIGHSCGALLQTLITSLFPDTPRAVNVLISYNNKPVLEAIPAFNEAVVPAASLLMGDAPQSVKLRKQLREIRKQLEGIFNAYSVSRFSPLFVSKELQPFYKQSVEVLDQLPELLRSIAQGQREFEPSPAVTQEAQRRMYRARRTLVVQFAGDGLDESSEVQAVLREANTIMRMKRPMIEMEVQLKTLAGAHITPLTPNLLLDVAAATALPIPDLLNPARLPASAVPAAVQRAMRTIDDLRDEIIDFLTDSIKGKQ